MTEVAIPTGGLLLSLSTCDVIARGIAAELRGPAPNPFAFNTAEIIDRAVPSATPSPWLTSMEAAEHLRIGTSELQRLAAADVIPSEQDAPGGRRFFDREELDHWRRSGGRRR